MSLITKLFKRDETDFETFKPPHDPVFQYLYERLTSGYLPLYRAEVPISLIRPFSESHRRDKSVAGRKLMNGVKREIGAGNYKPHLWVYPRDKAYVMSDDYSAFYALIELEQSFACCEIMGQPTIGGFKDLQGPAPLDFVRKLPGGPDFDPSKQVAHVIKEMPGD